MKSIFGTEIPKTTRGVLYLCHFSYQDLKLTVVKELFFESGWEALDAYANIPNPPSQMVTGRDYEQLIYALELLHKNMKDEKWLKNLAECL